MSTLDSSAPPNPGASNGNLPAIQYLQHPPNDLVGYHPQQSPMGHIPPHPSQHAMQQQPNAYLPQHNSYMAPNSHYSAQPTPYDSYPPPPPHQSPYGGVPHFTHSPHPPSPYGHQFHPEYHHEPFQYPGQFRNYVTDPSGQSGPPGMKPRVTTTLWEDEGTLCFQVEAKGICVARREDNNMINGTKLLNVAGMSRGKRDGILKSEKARAVVKVGAMHLKGVWIPFDRALDFANKERILDLLYPLFVEDIKAFLYHPANYARTNAVMAAAATRQAQTSPNVMSFNQPSQVPRRSSDGRPMMNDRSISFPTPPSSASSITNGTADLPWVSHTGLSLDTSGMPPVTRSLPGTPATSPSSAVHTGSQTYGALTDSHLHRQSLQFEPSTFKREAITQLHLSYPTGSQFSSRRASSASDMGPPPATVHSRLNTLDKDQLDTKHESLPESQEEGYQNDLHYNVPPGTPISASSNQVYNTPSIVAMKGRVDNPGTPTHTQSPSGNVGWSQKHEPPSQNEYAMSSQTHHARQLSYQIRGNEDQGPMVTQNGVSRNIFDSTPVDRDTKLSSLDYDHGDDVLQGGLPNGHSLHGSLPSIKQEQLIKDGPPSSKRRRTINQDSLPYNLGGPSPTQSTSDLSIPEGGMPTNGNVMHPSDQGAWNPYGDEYATVLGDPSANGRKRPPSRK